MSRYTITPKPYKVDILGKAKWVPKVQIYIHEGDKVIDRVVVWKRDILYETEEQARQFIASAMSNIERVNVQLQGRQIAALKAIAEENGQSLAEVFRQAISEYLPQEEND